MSSPRPPAAQALSILLVVALAAGWWLALRTWPTPSALACTVAPPTAVGAITITPTFAAPTAAPTEAPASTDTAALAENAFATQIVVAETEVIVRATQFPFATAQPGNVPTGQPPIASALRGGLSLQVRLPKDTYWQGETGLAEVTVDNDGPETVFIEGDTALAGATLLDDQGREPPNWPWQPISVPGFPYMNSAGLWPLR